MIEKFLEKFLPQITERLNENEEVGKALIEALAVLDNYATINNVQFTDEQVNTMLGVIPEPAPEPNADIPAEIVNIVENKKRGRKPKTTWSWRFKTAQEFEQEYGKDWYEGIAGTDVNWGVDMDEYNMAFLEGQPIKMSKESQALLNKLFTSDVNFVLNVEKEFGIKNPSLSGAKEFLIIKEMITDKPLPTAAAPTTWNWRFKTEEEFKEEYGDDWRKTIRFLVNMDYLLGKEIAETTTSKNVIEQILTRLNTLVDTDIELGISSVIDSVWNLNADMITNKPISTTFTPVAWNWRFKTEEEFYEEYGDDWRDEADWSVHGGMDYLLGQEIAETSNSRDVISLLQEGINSNTINTYRELGISSGDDDDWILNFNLLINKPLPTAAWNWRFKTEEEFKEEYGDNWSNEVDWNSQNMNYLFGQPIVETSKSQKAITGILSTDDRVAVDTNLILGISSGFDDIWAVNNKMITDKPLPTATPAKRGRKPKVSSNWSWRFKTEDEFIKEFGKNWRGSFWTSSNEKDYLFGQPIVETDESRKVIENNLGGNYYIEQLLGIKPPLGKTDYFGFTPEIEITQDPLPTAATPKKRGRKPKTTWNWRFKTLQELTKELGVDWAESYPRFDDDMKYLFGQPIQESDAAQEFIDNNKIEQLDTEYVFGIKSGGDDLWFISPAWLTQKPLPTAAAPAKSAPKKRGRKPKSELPEIDLGGLEDIGDIDIDDIDFDNLVI